MKRVLSGRGCQSSRNTPAAYDLVVIGGGINGAGIARDAAGRGLKVLLCEQDDLAAHTSGASTKLIHGGLRYLEYFEFGLVRKSLQERETLLRIAPHLIRPLRFIMPHERGMRPAWMLRAGLWIYDHLARRELLAGSQGIDLRKHPGGAALRAGYTRGFAYSDAWTDDARLVVINALDAHERGATILTRTRCLGGTRTADTWTVKLQSQAGHTAPVQGSGSEFTVSARALVNAAGPWVSSMLSGPLQMRAPQRMRLVKGSHIIVPRLFDHDFAYLFQNPDRRILFALPYEGDFTLIGTTDVEFDGDPADVAIDDAEIAYLCAMANRQFRRPIGPADVVHTYSGVRALLDDSAAEAAGVTRDYRLDLDNRGAPLLSVFGGKLTTYRRLAEEALNLLSPALSCRKQAWTATAPLPGGEVPGDPVHADETLLQGLAKALPWLPAGLLARYTRAYGSRAPRLLGNAGSLEQLGIELAPGVYERELAYLRDHEWALEGDDVLWRRSKLGLHLSPPAQQAVNNWMAEHRRARGQPD